MSLSSKEYQRRRAAHLCVHCEAPTGGFACCAACRKQMSEYRARLRADRIAAGICRTCGESPTDGKHRACQPCRETTSLKAKLRYVPVTVDRRRKENRVSAQIRSAA